VTPTPRFVFVLNLPGVSLCFSISFSIYPISIFSLSLSISLSISLSPLFFFFLHYSCLHADIADVFSIAGRGTVVTGRVERGILKKGTDVEIVGIKDEPLKTTVTGIEMFHKELDQAMAGDNLGLLLRGLRRDQISRGMVVAIPGTVKPVKKFLASFYILSKEEGGRSKGFIENYRPQLYAQTSGTNTGFVGLRCTNGFR